ncbi:DUF4880 domain-containing protein [Lampropedia puyangensis]|uniref:DUF4880 domain-containing protein n=1 Tax=Lampropedia puyangensis TaxID=1330072 RepID=A0A4S8FD81_9BURK|nr:FecR domain-containing protein [Lampropedia puyangensis]THU05111.1 DUF4880 domain-containing protein [Lampropedia puyangensis]
MNAPSDQALEQAADWYVLLQSGCASANDQQRWQNWLNASEEHQLAWNYALQVSQRFSSLHGPHAHTSAQAIDSVNRTSARLQRRQLLGALLMAGGSSVLGWATWHFTGIGDAVLAWNADHYTTTGEVREIALEDGTHLWLSSSSAIEVTFDAQQRLIHLLRGEILVQTGHAKEKGHGTSAVEDKTIHPFIVQTPHGQMQAMGTRFSVRLGESQSQLAVFEHAVQITTSSNAERSIVSAGTQTHFNATHIAPPQAADPNRQAWSRQIFIAQRTPLHELITELRRHQSGHISLAPEVADLPVLGSYPLVDTQKTLQMLERVLPIRVTKTLPWWWSVGAL